VWEVVGLSVLSQTTSDDLRANVLSTRQKKYSRRSICSRGAEVGGVIYTWWAEARASRYAHSLSAAYDMSKIGQAMRREETL
jgi:hypothetical protein